jgi:hypothetical protein
MQRIQGEVPEDELRLAGAHKAGGQGRFGLEDVALAERALVVAVFVDGDGRVRIAPVGVALGCEADGDAVEGLLLIDWRGGGCFLRRWCRRSGGGWVHGCRAWGL